MKIPLGKDNLNNTICWDLENHSTPHLLVGGATGSGKSVFIYSTLEYAKEAGIKEMIIMDPKYEFEHLVENVVDFHRTLREFVELFIVTRI